MHGDKLMDDIGRQIIREMQGNARATFSEIGRHVGLSSPAVAERVRRLEESGFIKGYRVEIDAERFGYPITAFIRVAADVGRLGDLDRLARETPEVIEAHHLTGSDEMLMKVAVPSVRHLGKLAERASALGRTTAQIVIASPVEGRPLDPSEV